MSLVITRDADAFAGHVRDFLAARVERNVLATVLETTRVLGPAGEAPLFAYTVDNVNRVTAVALRTPPWPLLADGFDDPETVAELFRRWLADDPDVPGVSAQPASARAIAAAWRELTGGRTECEFEEAMHALTVVIEPLRKTPGALRPAFAGDRNMLIGWERDFLLEAGLGTGDQAEQTVDRRTAAGRQVVWDDGGPVSAVGFNLEVAGTVRIGPVYTPPAYRNRGYATAAVAATSRLLLARGAQRCMLFTDLANPISNRIYAAIGYVRIGDWEQHRFHRVKLPN